MQSKKYKNNKILNVARARLWRRNQSWVCIILGSLGSGKSYAALAIADYLMKGEFDPRRLVFFRLREFIEAVKNDEIEKGAVVVLDEVGVSFSARGAMTKENRAIAALFQVMRFKCFALIMTCATFGLIDKIGRDIVNASVETVSINRENGFCNCKFKNFELNPMLGKTYKKYPRMTINGYKTTMKIMKIYKPPVKIINEYEKMKLEYTTGEDGLFSEIANIMNPNKSADAIDKEGTPVTCKCGHSWTYKGLLKRTKCASCESHVVVGG